MAELLFKVTTEDGSACHGGRGTWPLPTGGKPGAWKDVTGALIPCNRGLHLCRAHDLVYWLGPAIWEAAYDGTERIDAGDKVVVRRARLVRHLDTWNERTSRLFAADCAEHVLPIFEKECRGESRPRDAIAVARRFADGQATREELDAASTAAWTVAPAAAGDAAWAAVRAAAGDAAWAAARAAAWDAAWAAARAAAGNAAGNAAWAAAWAAERQWQTGQLAGYLGIEVQP